MKIVITGVVAVMLTGCVGGRLPSPIPTRSAAPSVGARLDATTRTFCGHLVAVEQQVARDLNGGNGDLVKIRGRLRSHLSEAFSVLSEEEDGLEGDTAADADDVIGEIGDVVLWKPGDTGVGLGDRVLSLVDRIDVFETDHCHPAG